MADELSINKTRLASVLKDLDRVATELADLRERFTALAAVEEHIGESCSNASHNIRATLAGEDPRLDAEHYGLDWRTTP